MSPTTRWKHSQPGAVVVGKTGAQVEIKREPRLPVGQLPLAQVLLRGASPNGLAGAQGLGRLPTHSRSSKGGVLGAALLIRVSNRQQATHVSALGQSVIEQQWLAFPAPRWTKLIPGLDEENSKLFDLLGELVAHELGSWETGDTSMIFATRSLRRDLRSKRGG